MNNQERGKTRESLQAKLDATRKGFQEQMPAGVLETFRKANAEVLGAGIEGRAAREGKRAADFALPNVHGTEVRLSHLLEQGPVVLAFYRGGW